MEWRSWEDTEYFCTPKDAEILGGPDEDGVHFVLIPGDKRVFCVEPLAEDSRYVMPVAASLQDFISYLTYTGYSLPVARLRGLTLDAFRAMVEEENRIWPGSDVYFEKRRKAVRILTSAYGVCPTDPYVPVHTLQEKFRPDEIRYSEDYEKVLFLERQEGAYFK